MTSTSIETPYTLQGDLKKRLEDPFIYVSKIVEYFHPILSPRIFPYLRAFLSWEPVGLTPHSSIFAIFLQKQAGGLLLPGRLRSLPPPSMAAFLRYCLSALFGRRVYDSHTRSKPPACFWCAAIE